MLSLTGFPSRNPSESILDHQREVKRQRTEWQGSELHSGQSTALSTDPANRVPLMDPPQVSQLPMGSRITSMDTQRLLSILKVIHTELQSLTERVKALEGVCDEIKEGMTFEFELDEDSDDSEDSGEEESESETESVASHTSAPASFQY